MEIFLRNKESGMYFQGVDDWTHWVTGAFNFQAPERVIRFIRAAQLDPAGMEIVFGFGDPHYNFALPIDERFEIKSLSAVDRHPARRTITHLAA